MQARCQKVCAAAQTGRKPSTLRSMLDTLRHRASLSQDTEANISTRRRRFDSATEPTDVVRDNSSDSPSAARMARTKSGVPLGLTGWGPTKLAGICEANLLIALQENGIDLPDLRTGEKADWAREALCMKCVFVLSVHAHVCCARVRIPHMPASPTCIMTVLLVIAGSRNAVTSHHHHQRQTCRERP